MIELEIQTLSERREGLLIDVGRAVVMNGFTLQRQRFTQDANGVLLTMVVRGPARKQRALEAALGANERIISFNASTFEEGPPKPHFAASRTIDHVPPPAPAVEVASPAAMPAEGAPKAPSTVSVAPVRQALVADSMSAIEAVPAIALVAAKSAVDTPEAAPASPIAVHPEPQPEPEPEFVFVMPRAPSPVSAPVEVAPFVELVALDADEEAVLKTLPKLQNAYPDIFSRVQTLERSVAEGARESSLLLVGQRTGAWVHERDYADSAKLGLHEALESVAIPALRALVEVEQKGEQLHIRNSPLCIEEGQSSCKFFSGYLEGLLGPIVGSEGLSVFAVCCRSCGADECVLAISD